MEAKCAILVGQKQAGRAGYETKPSSRPRAGPARRTPQGRGRRHPAGLFAGRRRGRVGGRGPLAARLRPAGRGRRFLGAGGACRRGVAGGLDQLHRTAGDGLHFGGCVPRRGRGHDGQLRRSGAEHRHRPGAALWGRHLPQRPVPLEPYLHRDAGGLPWL